jgi:formyltetrahydrofolate hydrolase
MNLGFIVYPQCPNLTAWLATGAPPPQGPIIEQDVARVNHRMSVQDFRAMGRSVECKVLHRAVKWHLEDRVFLVEGNKTVVFS